MDKKWKNRMCYPFLKTHRIPTQNALLSALPENAQGDRLLTIHDFTEELNEAGISITEE